MRYRRAVEKLQILAEACEHTKRLPSEEPFLREAYVFGDVLAGADPLDCVEVAFVLNLPPADVPWESHPHGTGWLVDVLRLDKGGIAYWWRSHLDPVWNHVIRGPVRFWSLEGPDEAVLAALAERRFEELRRVVPSPADEREQLAEELRVALERLRAVHGAYWDREWRLEHRGSGRYPEHHLWEAVQGYLGLLDARHEKP
ncbi:hypothetical protein Aple_026060 [Acrocarpospora pleiomorpha]|uniref:DUF7711 domain-containing protein n=1 Tax=Acrocarpospora pleiomorpha TaxID=90975 RepID=A0A5M3XF78_9ACTN|nr:hypothetical protein [Acrocarpospora pleiomorpha]GES19710.1 hypothetical protein Aple_026060 [Acrocarpospora pleiomorpha]